MRIKFQNGEPKIRFQINRNARELFWSSWLSYAKSRPCRGFYHIWWHGWQRIPRRANRLERI